MGTLKRRSLPFKLLLGMFAMATICGLSAAKTRAAIYYWDTNGSTAGTDGAPSGTWGTTNWSTDSAGTANVSPHTTTASDNLYFAAGPSATSGSGAYTVTVNLTQAANSLTFQSSGTATLSGDTVNLSGGGITVLQYAYGTTPQGPVTISSPIALQTAQTWVNNASSNLTLTGNVLNGTNGLTIAGSGNTTISSMIGSGSGGLTKTGLGTLTLTATNTFTGGTTITNGTLQLGDGTSGHDGALAATGGINDNNALIYNLFGSQGYSGVISGMGSVTKTGAGSMTLSGSNTYSGGTGVAGGTLVVTNTAALPGYNSPGKVAVSNGGTLILTGWTATNINTLMAANGSGLASGSAIGIDTTSGGLSYTNAFTGGMGLTKLGSNTLILGGTNNYNYTGLTTVSGGVLDLSSTGALQGSTLIAPAAGSSIVFDQNAGGVGFTFGGLSGSGNIVLQNNASFPTPAAIALTVGANSTSTTYSGTLSGTGGSLTKTGTGTLTLSGSNTYTSATTVSNGVLAVTSTSALPGYSSTSRITVGNGGTLALTAETSGSSWTQNAISSLMSANGSGFAAGSALGIDTTSGNFPCGYSLVGNMGLTKLGPNTLTFSASNSYSGPTAVLAGTLNLSNSAALQGSMLLVPTAGTIVFDQSVASHAFTLGGLGGSGNLVLQNSSSSPAAVALRVGNNGTNAAYSGILSGAGSLMKVGTGTQVLTATNLFTGGVTISAGILQFGDGTSGNDGSVIASGGIANNATLAYNLYGSQSYSGVISGSGNLTKTGNGILTLSASNTFSGGVVIDGGRLSVASSGVVTTATGKSIYVGNMSPAAMTIQDSATVTASELDVNNQATAAASPSTLTITGGSLYVTGQSYIGRAAMRTGPSTTSAAVYQVGGTATLAGKATVGFNGTAESLLDIGGGTLNANGGLVVGDGAAGSAGNGVVNIHGSGLLNVSGSTGLIVGQDPGLTTIGSVSLSAGSLNVGSPTATANLILGNNGGLATFTRSGGSMYVKGDLQVRGIATFTLDASTGESVATSFGGTLSHSNSGGLAPLGLLLVVPKAGDLGGKEAVSFAAAPTSTYGIIGPWAVQQTSGTNSSGDFLKISGQQLGTFTGYNSGFSGATSSSVVSISSTSSTKTAGNATIYAMKVSDTATINAGQTLTIGSGGLIVNGGTIQGGSLVFASEPLIFAGSNNTGTISSAIQIMTGAGLVKWGPGRLVLSGNNSGMAGGIIVGMGILNIQNAFSLGPDTSGNSTTVAAGATLEIQGGFRVNCVALTLNGTGSGGSGALRNVRDDNTLGGNIVLGSASQINVDAADNTLTLSGPIQCDPSAGLTKAGSGTLRLTNDNTNKLNGSVTVAGGVLAVRNSGALGPAGTSRMVAVQDGASLLLQGGISVPAIPLVLSGAGVAMGGALQSQDDNTFAGSVILAADSQINVTGSLTLNGNISGPYALSKAGGGTLLLTGSNSFTQGLSVLDGTLSIGTVNSSTIAGPLGEGTAPIFLGSNGRTATFLLSGSSANSSRAFSLGSGGTGVFAVDGNLGLSGVISGNGSLNKSGSGVVTLSGNNLYTGATTVSAGTLAVGSTGSINASGDLSINQGCVLQVTAGTTGGSQLSNAGNVTLSGGMLAYAANGSFYPGESLGALALNPGHSQVVLSNTGTGTPCLAFASGTSHLLGATVGFSANGGQIEFLANPPALVNGILPYAFVGPANSTNVDFATLSTSAGMTLVSAYSDYVNSMDTNGSLNVATTANQSLTTASTCNSLKLVGSASITMTGLGSLALNSGGIICSGTSTTISGGSISAPAGELIINTAADLNLSSSLTATGALVKTGTATATLSYPTSNIGSIFINQGTLAYATSSNVSYAQAISGVGNLRKSGSATLTLSGSNTYTGNTTVTGGVLLVNSSLAAGSAVSLQGGGLGGSGTINGNVTVSGGTIAQAFGGSIVGTVTATSGALTVGQTGTGDYLKTLGGLSVAGNATLAAGSTGAQLNGNLNYSSSSNSTFSGVIAGAGKTLTLDPQTGSPTLTLSGSSTYSGGTIIQGGTLRTANSAALGTGKVWLYGGVLDLDDSDVSLSSLAGTGGQIITSSGTSNLTVNPVSGVSNIYSGHINNGQGVVSLTKSGNGTLILSGSNNYSGGTMVSGGDLVITTASAIPDGSSLTVGAGGILIFDPASVSAGLCIDENLSTFAAAPNVAVSQATSDQGAPSIAVDAPSAVPEPSTLGLLVAGLGGMGLVALRRFSRNRRHVL